MKPEIAGTRYVLAVQNLEKSAQFYVDKLGFESLWKEDGWQFLVRGSAKIMLGECPDDVPAFETGCHSYFAYFEVKDVDDLYREFLAKEVITFSPPKISRGVSVNLRCRPLMDIESRLGCRFIKKTAKGPNLLHT